MPSSRTPEGEPASCPLCLAHVVVEPSTLIGDATCPRCGQLLWFIQGPEATHMFDMRETSPAKERAIRYAAELLAVPPEEIVNSSDFLHHFEMDSLDVVELVMLAEDDFD